MYRKFASAVEGVHHLRPEEKVLIVHVTPHCVKKHIVATEDTICRYVNHISILPTIYVYFESVYGLQRCGHDIVHTQ
jgi:hypothetical protein